MRCVVTFIIPMLMLSNIQYAFLSSDIASCAECRRYGDAHDSCYVTIKAGKVLLHSRDMIHHTSRILTRRIVTLLPLIAPYPPYHPIQQASRRFRPVPGPLLWPLLYKRAIQERSAHIRSSRAKERALYTACDQQASLLLPGSRKSFYCSSPRKSLQSSLPLGLGVESSSFMPTRRLLFARERDHTTRLSGHAPQHACAGSSRLR